MSQEKFEALRQNLSHKRRRRKNKVFYANAKGRARFALGLSSHIVPNINFEGEIHLCLFQSAERAVVLIERAT